MAVSIPQVVTEDRSSGAPVVDGSLKFDSSKSTHLQRTQVGGNRKTFTWSAWIKKGQYNSGASDSHDWFSASEGDTTGGSDYGFGVRFPYYTGHSTHSDQLMVFEYENSAFKMRLISEQVFRDHVGFYHIVVAVDTTIASPDSDRVKVYINGERITAWKSGYDSYPSQNLELTVSESGKTSQIGCSVENGSTITQEADGYASNFYLIDGQQLGPENFGFTDPLTNTWRPKKYTGDFNYAAASGTLLNYDSNTSLPTYSDQDGNSGTPSVYQMENAFDGDSSTYANMTYANGKWTRANFAQPITNVTRIDIGWDGEGDVGYNGSVVNSSVGYTGSRQSLTLYNGSAITLNNIHMVSQPGNGVCRLYDITITTTTQSATELTFTAGTGTNSFYLPMDGNSPIGQDQSGIGNDWAPVNFGGSTALDKATGAFPIINTLGGTIPKSGVFGSGVSESYTILGTSGGGNPYVFEDLGNRPQLSFIRGATYTFDWSAASSHPLRFATAADAAGSTEYTDGTDVTGNVTTITVPHNAPDTLYYYCNVHGGMGNSISVTTDETKADPYAWKNIISMPLNNAVDESGNINCTQTSQTVTNSSTSFAGVTNFYGRAASFSRSSANYLSVPDSAGIELGSDDFTIEFWLYLNNTTNQYEGIISKPGNADATAAPLIYKETTGNIHINFSTAGSANWNIGQSVGHCSDLAFKWHHIAITREGSTFRFFLDGVFVKTQTNANALYDNGNPLYIGKYTQFPGSATYGFDGYLQDFRLYKGVAKYTPTTIGDQAFIPASTNPDVLPETPSGVATKTQLTKIPSSDSNTLLFPTQASKIVLGNQYTPLDGTGDYTISFWFFASEYNSADNNGPDGGFDYILTQAATHPTYPIGITISKAGKIVVQDSANFGSTWLSTFDYEGSYNTSNSIVLGQWSYVHVVRSSGTLSIYNNGNLQYSRSQSSSSPTPTGDITICLNTGSCFVKDFRIEGAAITDPTPPTGSPTATGNTRLLLDGLNDVSGNNVALTVTGDVQRDKLSPFITTDINTVHGQAGSYATFDPLQKNSGVTLSNGNIKLQTVSNAWKATQTTIPMKTGKYYWEFGPFLWRDNNNHCQPGVAAAGLGNAFEMGQQNFSAFYHYSGTKYINASQSSFGRAWNDSETNIIGIAFDADTRKVWFSKNGIWQGGGNPSAGTNEAGTINLYLDGTYYPTLGSYGSLNGGGADANFGQKPFKFPPPDGFQPLTSSTVRPDTVISRPDQYVGIVTFRGTGTTPQSITGLNFNAKPDLVWIKDRDNAYSHRLADSVRGSTRVLFPDQTNNEQVNEYGTIDRFTLNGFDLRQGSNNNGDGSNTNNADLVAWCWRAGGSKGTFNIDDVGYATAAAAGLTAGDSSSVTGCSIGTKQGFSIIKYSGANTTQQIPHGLGQAPRLCIVKNLTDGSTNWVTSAGGSGGIFSDSVMFLNTTDANNAGLDGYWGGTSANSTVVYVGGNQQYTNQDSNNYIMYNWIDVPGLQKFGTYTGNGSADGPFVELGFQPAIIWMKNVSDGSNRHWCVVDSTRSTYNKSASAEVLFIDDSQVESYANDTYGQFGSKPCVDILSNGFKLREANTTGVWTQVNNTHNYIYCAWAEAPTVNLYGATSNAR